MREGSETELPGEVIIGAIFFKGLHRGAVAIGF